MGLIPTALATVGRGSPLISRSFQQVTSPDHAGDLRWTSDIYDLRESSIFGFPAISRYQNQFWNLNGVRAHDALGDEEVQGGLRKHIQLSIL